MKAHSERERRQGAAAIEAALVLPVMFFLTIGMIVVGVGVFNHQQVACQAREAARWASVRGGDYQKDTDLSSPTKQDILQQTVLPMAAGMDPQAMTVDVEWLDKGLNTAQDWDAAPRDTRSITPGGEYTSNSVRVTVTYNWTPGILLGTVRLRSVCEMPMSN